MSCNKVSPWKLTASLMSDGFFVLQDARFIYVNSAFEQLLGADPGQLLGQGFERFVHPEVRSMVVSRHRERLKGVAVPRHYEISLLGCDRKTRVEAWIEIEMQEGGDRQKTVAGIVRDIGSYQSLKSELAAAQQQLSSIMGNMSDTVYQTNMLGEVTLISDSVVSLLGYKPEEMIGTLLAAYYWSPEEREKVVNSILQNNGVITNVEAILRRKDGSPV